MAEKKSPINADVVLACIEDKFFQKEILIEQHAILKILSGEMRVVQADRSYTFGAGDIILFPRNTLATVIKYPKDDRPYRSVLLYIRSERLQTYYAKNNFPGKQQQDLGIQTFKAHQLFESFFASLLPYLEMDSILPG